MDGAQISITPCSCGGVTDNGGRFTISLPPNTYTVTVNFLGYKEQSRVLLLNSDQELRFDLAEQEEQLSEVVLRAKRINENLERPQMGVLQLSAQDIKKIPLALGEFDVLRSLVLLPGVNDAGEISNGLSVRGGSLDQNLVLYDYAPVFNPTHLFGLFSVFTPDLVASADLFRANIPAKYGGRSTSVLDVRMKKPYSPTPKLSGGIGLVSSNLTFETPLIKDKLMMIAGGRVGLNDFLLPLFSERLQNTKARFADGTLKLLYLPTEKDQLSLSGFYSQDFYQLDLVTRIENVNSENNQYDFGILNGTLDWLHSFDEDTNLKTVLVGSTYFPKIIFPEVDSDNEIVYESKINYYSLITEFNKRKSEDFSYYLGVQANHYNIHPGDLDPGSADNVLSVSLEEENSYELSGYANVDWKPTENLSLSGGLRYNHFSLVGPYNLANFDDTGEITDSQFFEEGEGVTSYNSLEPRLGLSLKLGESSSVKASYARLNQYLQNVFNSTTPLPTSRWTVASPNIQPQISDNYSVGWFKNLNDGDVEIGVEAYYRDIQNILTYKPGADFFLEEFLDQFVVQGQGRAYGLELSYRKPTGKVNGWFNYSWSRSLLRTVDEDLQSRINDNDWFPSDFDRPHVFNGTVNFEGNKFNTVSLNFTAQTGRPYTIANGFVEVDGIDVPIFLERNNARLPTYHRLDFSWTIKYSKKEKRRWIGDWTFTIYNVYGRRNPYNRYYAQRVGDENTDIFLDNPLGTYEISVLNAPLFSLSYNFTFQ